MPNGKTGSICAGTSMDNQILRELFGNCIKASEILSTDAEFSSKLKDMRARLRPDIIGKHGQMMEWAEDYDETEPVGHTGWSRAWIINMYRRQ